jgi:geranylgeranyl pyrophosphate synthase
MDFSTKLNALIARVEKGMDQWVPSASTRPARIHEAMRYSLEAGGKRLRPVLVLAAAELFGPSNHDPVAAAVAVECIHTYSLIHDDLPCMDDDDLRRGRPTAHKQFDEATALLAGDGLLTQAFIILAKGYRTAPVLAQRLIEELAVAAGSERLIGGQMEDLAAEKTQASPEQLEYIHLNKTAAMITASLAMGGISSGVEAGSHLDALRRLGRELGLAFQVVDDILDATSDRATLGKTPGKDAKADKTTFVKLHGLDGARRYAHQYTDSALEALKTLPGDTTFLEALVRNLETRIK